MSRHRNVRSMNYEDECYDDDDYLGHSVEDSYCISPGTVAQFTFNRGRDVNLSSYMEEEGIPEEDEDGEEHHDSLNDSSNYSKPKLSDTDEARLNSCMEGIRNVLGESCPDHIVAQSVIKNNYNMEAALNDLLIQQDAPKPQRAPRQNRRNRSQGFASEKPTIILKDVPASKVKVDNKKEPTRGFDNKKESSKIEVTPVKKPDKKDPKRGFDIAQNSPAAKKDTEKGDKSKIDMGSTNGAPEIVIETRTSSLNTVEGSTSEASSKSDTSMQTPKKDSSGTGAIPKSASKIKLDQANLKEEYEKRQSGKELLNMVVIGHVDAGKSTLMGHLLFQLGVVNKRAMHKYEQESKKMGKGSFVYAWVLDETEEERARGVTMDIAQTRFETPKKHITLLDAPGHKDFIPNMITGTAQADAGILVVNATRGEFESGFESGGQTREHAVLARSLGVSQLIVAVNKMDTVGWTQERYDEIVKKLGTFLKQAGYKDSDISFVPCSGLNGENLTKTISEPKLSSWYKGCTLVEQIDKFKAIARPTDKPFRLSVGDVFKGMGSGFSVAGRIGSGSLQAGDKVLVLPVGEIASVKGITLDDLPTPCAFAGDHVLVTITGIDITNVNLGSVLCDPQNPIKSAMRIQARVVIFNLQIPITKGFPVVFHYQSITEPAVIKRLVSQLNKNTGEIVRNRPKCLTKNSSAVIEIEFERPVCLELYKDFKDLGRFMLRSSGVTIAAGLVEEVLKFKSKSDDQPSASS